MEQRKKHKCGCISYKNGDAWVLKDICKEHTPNYQKKADKLIHKKEVYEKRQKFLKERVERKRHEK